MQWLAYNSLFEQCTMSYVSHYYILFFYIFISKWFQFGFYFYVLFIYLIFLAYFAWKFIHAWLRNMDGNDLQEDTAFSGLYHIKGEAIENRRPHDIDHWPNDSLEEDSAVGEAVNTRPIPPLNLSGSLITSCATRLEPIRRYLVHTRKAFHGRGAPLSVCVTIHVADVIKTRAALILALYSEWPKKSRTRSTQAQLTC